MLEGGNGELGDLVAALAAQPIVKLHPPEGSEAVCSLALGRTCILRGAPSVSISARNDLPCSCATPEREEEDLCYT